VTYFYILTYIINTRIFGAFGPFMFALRVWLGFGGVNPYFLIPTSCLEGCMAVCSEGHMAACSEGHFLSIVCSEGHFLSSVRKDTF
jgi:hypothetical protein